MLGSQFELFHGTGGGIEGGVVRPNMGAFGRGAYATPDLQEAEMYAKFKGQEEGRLFGTVYKVAPVSTASVHRYPQDLYGEDAVVGAGEQFEYHRDPVGMEVKGTASFPATYDPHEGENATQRRQRLIEGAAETVAKNMR